jgi:phosphoglycolate phosphatase
MKAVLLFDFDGVIANSLDVYFAEFTAVCTEMGYRRLNSREAFLKLFEGNALRRLLWAGFPLWRLRRLAEYFRPRISRAMERVYPFPNVVRVINDLAARVPVYVITSNSHNLVSAFLERHGIASPRDILGADHAGSKVRKIRRIMRQHPGCTAFYIGDTKGDMLEAHRAGVVPIAVTWGWHPVEKLREGAPDHIVDSPSALGALLESLLA